MESLPLPLAPEFQRDLASLSSFLFDAQLLAPFLHLPIAKSWIFLDLPCQTSSVATNYTWLLNLELWPV